MKRPHYAIAALLFLAWMLASVYAMAGRVDRYNAQQSRSLWVFQPVNLREFRFAGQDVTLLDAPEGPEMLTLRYGEREVKIAPSMTPGDRALPGLARHADWLKVLRFAEFGRRSHQEFLDHLDEGNDRIVIVARRPLTGPDPRTGDVWQRDWMFDFHELQREGTIKTEGLRFPKTKGDKTPKPGELTAGTWQMEAALHLMPKTPPDSMAVGRPTAAFRGDAMKAMGWTLPSAAVSAVGFVACLVLAAAPRRQKRPAS